MKLTEQLLGELDREAARTKRVLEQVPAGRDDWKPHEKSMALGRLAGMIATMPAWVTFIVKQDELDLTPPGGGEWKLPSQSELVAAHDKSVADARATLQAAQRHLLLTTNWSCVREVRWCRRPRVTSRCATCSTTWRIIAAS